MPARMVLDGGSATELERKGYDVSGTLWSARALIDAPDLVRAVHLDYLAAGADCISTASYQLSFAGMQEAGFSATEPVAALRQSVLLAREACAISAQTTGRHAVVAASLGAYGASLHNGSEYHGNYACTFQELVDFHRSRIEVLAAMGDGGADILAFETIPSLEEARAILVALEGNPSLPGWIAFTCRNGSEVAHGEPIAECAALLDTHPQIAAMGLNCTSPSLVISLLDELRSQTAKPLVVYPNSGQVWDAEERCWLGDGDLSFSEMIGSWLDHGAGWVGGCCGTGPAHIAEIRRVMDAG
ncbi:homocysteine S-methyltransferase [Granulicella aggregans]|uniref:homocysteine S-methyltransferase n=1 Tax=Granulicella aggregans TaxID=474949 RepID=UPI0021E01497|nr:homocysteine S-methyltransferase [Granulicella aggregans]